MISFTSAMYYLVKPTFQHSVAVKLVHDERSIDVSGLLDLVGDDAADEVRVSRV